MQMGKEWYKKIVPYFGENGPGHRVYNEMER
jgi:hypothetical protein